MSNGPPLPPGGGSVPPGGGLPPGGHLSRPGGGQVGAAGASSADLASVMSMLQSAQGGTIDVEMLQLLNQVDLKRAEVETFGADAQAELAAALAEAAGSGAAGPGSGATLGVPGGGAMAPVATASKEELQLLMQSISRAQTGSGDPSSADFAAAMAAIDDSPLLDVAPPPPLSNEAGSRSSITGGLGATAYTTIDGTMQSGPSGSSSLQRDVPTDPSPYASLPPPSSFDLLDEEITSSAPTLATLPAKDDTVAKEDCVKHGWMEKLGGRKKDKWQRRWAELDLDTSPGGKNGGGFILSYKASPMDKKMKGVINLTSCAVTTRVPEEDKAGKTHVIKLAPAYGAKKKDYLLGFYDQRELDDWLTSLNNAVKYNSQNRRK